MRSTGTVKSVDGQRQTPPPRTLNNGPQLHFQIDRITLHGCAPGAQARFVNSLSESLAALAQSRRSLSWPQASRELESVDAGRLRPGASLEEAGRLVARQIFAALGKRAGGNIRV